MSRRKIVTERDIRAAIYDRNGIKWFRMQIDRRRINESLATNNSESAFQVAVSRYFRNGQIHLSSNMRLSKLYDLYVNTNPDRSKSYLNDINTALNMLIDVIGDQEIRTIREHDADRFRVALLQRKKGNGDQITGVRINNIMRMCHAAFHVAERRGIIPRHTNPFFEFPRTKVFRKQPISYTPKQYGIYREKAVEIYGEEYALMLDLYLLTGCRESEWCDTQWHWIDWDEGLLILPPEYTKTGISRKIPLVLRLLENLTILKERGYKRPVPFGASEISNRWIHLRTGERIERKTYQGTGIAGTHHSLRKTVQSELDGMGLNSNLINGLLGHVPKSVPETFYFNYDRNIPVIRKAIAKMAKRFGL